MTTEYTEMKIYHFSQFSTRKKYIFSLSLSLFVCAQRTARETLNRKKGKKKICAVRAVGKGWMSKWDGYDAVQS